MDRLLPIVIAIVVLIVAALVQRWISSNFDYQCANCGEIFSLSAWQAMFVPHSMGKKLVRCPHCGQTTWATPVPKGDG
jgi:DNA-directed RNA polymerase subunit RPC12/RpoP